MSPLNVSILPYDYEKNDVMHLVISMMIFILCCNNLTDLWT